MVTLEAMHHHKEVDADKVRRVVPLPDILVEGPPDFVLADLVGALNALNEDAVCVEAVALFEDNWADLRQSLL